MSDRSVDVQVSDPVPRAGQVTLSDLGAALRAGWGDFRAAPQYGLFFACIYVISGFALLQLGAGLFTWTLTLTLGFPLIAPFLAVGLYEVSRRRCDGVPLVFSEVLAVVWNERTRQIPWAGAVILIYFLFWSFVAHMLFALFMGPTALLGPPDTLAAYLSGPGLAMAIVQILFGGACAFLLFGLTALSLPMLLEREVDFVTAMRASLGAVRANLPIMMVWAAIIAVTTLLAMVPWFLGLLIVLPVLGHASWHLYRAAMPG
ncbi:DUF2189 domain-containing protein [Jannaschia aquimarina]|uniref:Integral membrane protein n=1 Tax=Jannaschia aquimarina TaxID=935700 RepID=A0A0D1D6T7_9RHOB|nr:DUF2189 domain-containing protein [Jannaschia aquimarina]KIT15673.1 hypothetical protein jaqu_25500 [Jannaschia aquimarina]SNT39308.1 Uncharacterized membrane protein [Jannaschia aquimarina]